VYLLVIYRHRIKLTVWKLIKIVLFIGDSKQLKFFMRKFIRFSPERPQTGTAGYIYSPQHRGTDCATCVLCCCSASHRYWYELFADEAKQIDGVSLPVQSWTGSDFRGLVVSMLASGTQYRGFAPDRSRRIFPAGKIYSMPSFGRRSKIICPMLVSRTIKKGNKKAKTGN
jgi:hypothetical protein